MTEEDLFLAALDQPDAAARAACLAEACGSDAGLRDRVEALLANHFRSGEFLDVPAAEQIQAASNKDNTVTMGHAVSATKNPDDEADGLSFLAPSTRPDSLGRIGHYEILQVLGKGGFGIVFRAFDDVLQRVVALKVMAPQLATTSPARKRFLREARTSAAVRHENVVQVYEVGESPLPYLVMEFIPGETMQERLNRVGPVEPAEVVRIGRQIAEGLAAAHATDFIHRDIKPGNILLEGGQLKAKITDFGLARAADDASISQSGIIAGTPMYMAPEQAKGEKLDQRADLFSLGSILYQMVSGRAPFRANSTMAVLKRVAEDPPRDIREIIPETPQWLCNIIAKLHAKNPDERYQSAREVADVLADCENQLKSAGKVKTVVSLPVTKHETSPSPSGRWKWAAAAVLVLPIIALAVTELAGVTHWLRRPQTNTISAGLTNGGREDKPRESGPGVPANEQIEVLRKEMKRLNPRFDDDTIEYKVDEDGVVVELKFLSDHVTDISPVRALTGLKSLSCKGSYSLPPTFKSSGLSQLADLRPLRGLPLERLECSATAVSDITPLKGMPLEHFVCSLTAIADLSALDPSRLKTLLVPKTKITDASLEHFEGCTNITKLMLFSNEIGDLGISAFSKCNGLVELYLDGTKVTNKGLALFHDLPDLETLHLSYTKVTNEGLRGFADSRKLTALSLGSTGITELGLAVFRGRTWTNLDLHGTQITDEGLKLYFQDCGSLRSLKLGNTKITDAGLEHFAGCRELEELNLFGNPQIGDAGLAHFAGCSNLKQIQLQGTRVTDAGMVQLRNCRQLEWISLNGMRVGDAGLASLRDCTELAYVNLSTNGAITDAGMAHLGTCRNLRELHLSWTNIGDAGLAHLSGCPNLEILHLRSPRMTNAGLKKLVEGCPNLRVLDLFGTDVTDFSPLKNLRHLEFLSLDFQPDRDTEVLRSISSLQRINHSLEWREVQPIEDFWKQVDRLGRFKSDEWIDVIPLIDPAQDKHISQYTGKSEWRKANGSLINVSDGKPAKLILPLDADWKTWDCEIEVTSNDGKAGFEINIPNAKSDSELRLMSDDKGWFFYFVDPDKNKKQVPVVYGIPVEANKPLKFRLHVDRQAKESRVSIYLGDSEKPAGTWNGNLETISDEHPATYDRTRRVSFWIHANRQIEFQSIRVRILNGGTASTVRPLPAVTPFK